MLACAGCASSQVSQNSSHPKVISNDECSFDSQCPGGSCQFGRCSQIPGATSHSDDTSPREIIPATGGPPIIGIPTGGGTYIPATGGPPIIGTPVGP